ncbi:MAG: hypothetical protein IKX00_02560 [Bacilli bacterium]|nr:hypothetical protein [Bacilli bacterium]
MIELLDKYLNNEEQKEFLEIVKPIIESEEFKYRCTSVFKHHDNITLGEHILEVAILTYLECKKRNNVSINEAVYIAMMHDLYTNPWQNNPNNKVKYFFNKHGFRHPVEAVINSANWFPEIYKKYDINILIDGIIHHMYPLPVRVYNDKNLELKTNNQIDGDLKKALIDSTNRCKIGDISFCRSRYKEGRIVSMCDKKVTRIHLKNVTSLTSGVTGRNKNITN